MPCPFSSGSLDPEIFSRRDILKSTLAVGGASALSACLEARGMPEVPRGPESRESIPTRQYAWNEYLPRDLHGNLVFPRHQLILLLDYSSDDVPDPDEREQVEDALRSLERAYQRGNGGDSPYRSEGTNAPGLLFTLGYSRQYFERFGADGPQGVNLPSAEQTLERLGEPTDRADGYDAAMVLVSDHAQVLLSVELALFGELDELNNVSMTGTFDDVFEKRARRTGFIGPGVPRHELDNDSIPERSPLGMGFVSGFDDNQASEDAVALRDGPFKGGTIQHISRLAIDLDSWYEEDHETRVHQMFSPHHDAEDVGEAGEDLASDSGTTRSIVNQIESDATNQGTVGHTQKLAKARNDQFEPLLLRRSEAISTGEDQPGFNFTSLQRTIDHFVQVREAMDVEGLDIPEENNGILSFIETHSRGNYFVPPRHSAALPMPS